MGRNLSLYTYRISRYNGKGFRGKIPSNGCFNREIAGDIAGKTGLEIEMLNQFSRTQLLLGADNMDRLAKAKVAIFGIGGVGGYVAEALARAESVPLCWWTMIRSA